MRVAQEEHAHESNAPTCPPQPHEHLVEQQEPLHSSDEREHAQEADEEDGGQQERPREPQDGTAWGVAAGEGQGADMGGGRGSVSAAAWAIGSGRFLCRWASKERPVWPRSMTWVCHE